MASLRQCASFLDTFVVMATHETHQEVVQLHISLYAHCYTCAQSKHVYHCD